MIAFLTSARSNSQSLSCLPRDVVSTSRWLISALAAAGRATSMCLGSVRNRSESFLIGGGMVAENSSVCRRGGSLEQIISMSGTKPMSSIRAASSITRISKHDSRSLPRPNRSEEHTYELQSLMPSSYAVFCLKQHNTYIYGNIH